MLENIDNIINLEGEAPVIETGTTEKRPKKRGPGRPAGAKNMVGADARALLAKNGLAGVKALCAIAAGRAVYRPIASGAREKLVPDLQPDACGAKGHP
jgi:hypothetical protein